ncbi:NTPase [Bacillus coahuilensis p1.1.43]|uniref:inosine/xanthosine triphosphatase n=1 Tax=Bacillus coahuilensis p1.1.43 TaxID=1150625 RepID=A0A147K6K9_9BACI|nr:DUF84 family protein [Bacillus coahuilensis]KUP05529.1 NTPase [Bacillus coahuilensis p1.1.43]
MNIAIGSKNPAKVGAVERACRPYLTGDFYSVDVDSGVSSQPFTDEETIQGAVNRAKKACLHLDANMGFGLEGGVQETSHGLFLCNWGAIYLREQQDSMIAGGARILLPEEIACRLRNGEELGPVMNDYSNRNDVRSKEGAVGIFTNSLMTRGAMFEHVTTLLIGQYLRKVAVEKG